MATSDVVWGSAQAPLQTNLTGTGAYVELLVAFVVVLLLMGILFRFLGRRVGVQQRGSIQVVAAKQIAPNKSIQVISVGHHLYLVGVGENVELLADVTDTYDEVAMERATPSLGRALSSTLAELRRRNSEEG
jgi:flagellar protein FliO/FliZ